MCTWATGSWLCRRSTSSSLSTVRWVCCVVRAAPRSFCRARSAARSSHTFANPSPLTAGDDEVIEVQGTQAKWAAAGDTVSLGISGIEEDRLGVGQVICDGAAPVAVADAIVAQIVVFDFDVAIIRGSAVLFHRGSTNEPAHVTRLVSLVNKSTGEVIKQHPRAIGRNASAVVEVKLARPICVECYRDYKDLGRFMLRVQGRTIAAGVVTEVRR
eukprot:Unigene15259_Nuclearia_a/m.45645 Unigene15259_Nuclearia_a/g.45645  ORF Unigene15259_Nuclearia_a/g.45645 Unigene15259_Nuclearia_a/m.45645 type:complete len:214 (-) Unigene15259_Nuclearia_a:53-694(-)